MLAALIFRLGKFNLVYCGFASSFRRMTQLVPAKLVWVTLISGLMVGGAPNGAEANLCKEPVFGVKSVQVDQRAATASLARDEGMQKAAETAFGRVLGRLLLNTDQRDQFIAAHSYDHFSDFVQIVKENSLDQRYIATLDFCFNASLLRQAMVTAGLNWSELHSPNILVIPVWTGPEGTHAWHRNNNWITGWRNDVNAYDGLLSFRQLAQNLTNERQFRGEDIALATPAKLAAAARLGDAQQVMVVEAALDFIAGKPEVTITATLYDDAGIEIAEIARLEKIVRPDSKPAALADLRAAIIQKMAASWHSANLIDGGATGFMTVFIPVSSVKDWALRLADLSEVAIIQNYKILSLNTNGGQVSLRLAGSREALQNALAARQLQLVDEGDRLVIKP